jgi:hypothetical protein
MTKIELGSVVQVGIVVRDARAAANAWTERFAMAPAQVVDWPPEGSDLDAQSTFRGRPGNFRMRLAFIETGPVQIEFIEPLEGDNIYSEFLEEKGEGLHHLLFRVPDPEGVAQELKVDIIQSGGSTLDPGAVWAYLDTEEILGSIIELKTKRQE